MNCHSLRFAPDSGKYFQFTEENSMEAVTRANGAIAAAGNAADAVLNKASSSAHDAVEKAAGAADSAMRKVEPAIDRVATMAHAAVDKVADAAGPAAHWLEKKGDSLKETQRRLTEGSGQYVSAHPWKAVGIALAAGILISRLIR
jgi:ElaB/YqjD/DUF883 family membrane-anchored ribosome-binding protein